MSFNSDRKKITSISEQNIENSNSLDKKTRSYDKLRPKEQHLKNPKILYDSDWITPGILIDEEISGNQDIYFEYEDSTAYKTQRTPFKLNYSFSQDFNIPEQYLSFIKPLILIDQKDEVEIDGVSAFQSYEYGDNYFRVKGDSTLIYQGLSPAQRFFPESERVNGNFQSSLAGKWYGGTLQYTIGSDSYRLENSYIVRVKTYYDVVPLPGFPNYYSSKSFESLAIDSISSSSIIGEGTYTITTATENPPGVPQQSSVITKNVQMTAPMFEDLTILVCAGNLYKNGNWQASYSDLSPLFIDFQGNLGGNATLVSFSYTWTNQLWKLFYSNKRAKVFYFNEGTKVPTNLPEEDDYQGSVLPYSHLYVDVNPDDYPEIEQEEDIDYRYSQNKDTWTKIDDEKYTFHTQGQILLSAPAIREETTPIDFVDETYSQSGDTYVRDSINRDDKDMPLYYPNYFDIKIKLILAFSSSLNYDTRKIYKI